MILGTADGAFEEEQEEDEAEDIAEGSAVLADVILSFPNVSGKSLDEVLGSAGDTFQQRLFKLSPSNKFNLIITYFITNNVYDIYEINAALFKYGQPILGE